MAALLFDPGARPDAKAVIDLADSLGSFAIDGSLGDGTLAIIKDGLSFEVGGLRPGQICDAPEIAHRVALPSSITLQGKAAITVAAGKHLVGADHLLPVVRVMAALIGELGNLPGAEVIVWQPARLATSVAWFHEAVGVWLGGGPFPALALTALIREADSFASEGLHFLTGQEFVLAGKDGQISQEDSRIAIRLTDWLVAHGRLDSAREVVLSGFGKVLLELDGAFRIKARPL
ncbi:hypothetical protein [Novosphingobium cyanobacteriorum]|uniref:Uncharacterized protein n=1 Tax=Novosphingobium cyanobacteriorum TaxID=3024215 RepID=A0ABT6CCI2_9SPHN|nr:hypothetical protein [Novosphingobium cyanobacteriorum]MDF8331644.1 hypothetical protein [Novosphingobium cyanobacteriorum]